MRTCVIGDIHGCHRELCLLLDRLAPSQGDRLVFLGDFVDRGPQSRQVVEEVLGLQRRGVEIVPLMGNHEEVLLAFLAGREREFYLAIGGHRTLASYGCSDPLDCGECARRFPKEHLAFFHGLLPYWEDEEFIYVHAGLQPGVHLSQQSPDWLYWGAGSRFLDRPFDFGKRVIFGHSVHSAPLVEPNRIGLDTGAVYGGRLTALVLPAFEFVQVEANKYWPPA